MSHLRVVVGMAAITSSVMASAPYAARFQFLVHDESAERAVSLQPWTGQLSITSTPMALLN